MYTTVNTYVKDGTQNNNYNTAWSVKRILKKMILSNCIAIK